MTHDNKLQVEAIKRGTVIDHIPTKSDLALSLFKLTRNGSAHHHRSELAFWRDGPQRSDQNRKYLLSEDQVDQLALYAPQATVNRIDNYEVVGKSRPSLPERIDNVLVCPNSNYCRPCRTGFFQLCRAKTRQ